MDPRILMLGWGFPPNVTGGLDTWVGEVFEAFESKDAELELLLPAEYAPEDREGIHSVPTGDGDIITRVGRMSDRFVELADEADIAHTNDWFGYGPGLRAKRETDAVWVSEFHSLSSDRNINPPEREVETERRVARQSDVLICVSDLTRQDVLEQYGVDSHIVHNGFSSLETTGVDVKADLGIEGPMLLFVGRHTDQKGISHLIYAMDKIQDTDATLVLGGSGHQTEHLKMFAELLGLGDRVVFAGYIPEEKLGDYYAAADVFISPSRAEPFGLTITEALAAGAQVVATPSGVRETLPDGCLVEVTVDSDSIARGIEEALAREGPPEYEPRTWDEVADDLLDVYTSALE
ncbi:MAG: glycosyltransferase family 4 protein [Halohasta sp.]